MKTLLKATILSMFLGSFLTVSAQCPQKKCEKKPKCEKKCDKKGNITYTVLLKGKDLVGAKNAKEAKITLKKGSNDVEVHVKYSGGGVSRRAGSTVYIGSLHQMDAAAIEKVTLYR